MHSLVGRMKRIVKNNHGFSVTITMLFIVLPLGLKTKKPIQTKYRMPLLNWQTLKPTQVKDTVFNELDDEQVLGVRILSNIPTTYLKKTQHLFISVFIFICY